MKRLNVAVAGNTCLVKRLVSICIELGHEVVGVATDRSDIADCAEQFGVRSEPFLKVRADLYVEVDAIPGFGPEDLGAPKIVCNRHYDLMTGKASVKWSEAFDKKICSVISFSESPDCFSYGADAIAWADHVAEKEFEFLLTAMSKAHQWPELIAPPGMSEVIQFADEVESKMFFHRKNRAVDEISDIDDVATCVINSISKNKNKPALMFRNKLISYAELDEKSASLAGKISDLLGRNESLTPVAIMLPKSLELYYAIMAVLRLGQTYVPIDISYPDERVKYILENSGAKILIAEQPGEDIASVAQHVLSVSEGMEKNSENHSKCVRSERASESDVVALIYTSGSTGVPKGVRLSNKNLGFFLSWYGDYAGIDNTSRVLQFSSVSFDASLLDILPTWAIGGCLVVPEEQIRTDPHSVEDLCRVSGVTHAFFPPAMLAELCPENMGDIKTVVMGGDLCDPRTIAKWVASTRLINIYGPTECTIFATSQDMSLGIPETQIGVPVPGASCFVIDEFGRACPTGEIGELYISGPGVSPGYWLPSKSDAERFIKKSFFSQGGAYRTGDLAFWTEEGVLNFVGRKDTQVKVRGYRVELGEIEAVIREAGIYRQCVVEIDGDKRIVACVVDPIEGKGGIEDLRYWVKKRLPVFMQPSFIIPLSVFPLTPNGKVDRAEIRKIIPDLLESTAQIGQELNESQRSIRDIWSEVLAISPGIIGVDDSFFDLGGHSLKVSKMLLAYQKKYGKTVPISNFVLNPTIRAVADYLDSGMAGAKVVQYEDFAQDMQLPPDLVESLGSSTVCDRGGKIMLTGATGFLGAFLLDQLVRDTEEIIVCLGRGSCEADLRNRVEANLIKYKLPTEYLSQRVEFICGDVSLTRLGLADKEYERLAYEVGSVYHAAAKVNHVLSYQELKSSNVESVRELIGFSARRSLKEFNFVSTVAAASATLADGRLGELRPDKALPKFINNGYAISKWVSEHLLANAADAGMPVKVFRPGNIVGDTNSGACDPFGNRILLLLKGCVQLGFAPAWEKGFDFSPVDFVAAAIVGLSRRGGEDKWFNLVNKNSPSWVEYLWASQKISSSFVLEDPSVWQGRLRSIDEKNALYQVLGFYLDEGGSINEDMALIDATESSENLKKIGVHVSANTKVVMQRHFEYLRECGFL